MFKNEEIFISGSVKWLKIVLLYVTLNKAKVHISRVKIVSRFNEAIIFKKSGDLGSHYFV